MTKIIKCTLLYIVLVLLSQNMLAQNFKITKGMCLRYNVTSEGEKFKMYVIMKDVFPSVKFVWIMMKSPIIQGTIALSTDAWKTSDKQNNLWDPGDQKLGEQTCLWLSQYVFSSLKNNGDVKMTPDQNEKHYFRKGYKDFPVNLDGKATTIKVLYTESDDSTKDKFWIVDNVNSPFVTKMDIGIIKLELYEIRSVSQILPVMNIKGDDLESFIGKTSFDPQIYYVLNQLSEPCFYTPEYKVAKDGKETVFFHVLSRINGVEMEIIDDTVRSMVIYNNVKGDENSGWTRYPGELPGGITFDMKREEIEKLIGKPTNYPGTSKTVSYGDRHFILTYNSEDPKKGKIVSIAYPPK